MQFLIGQCTMKIMLTTTRAMCKLQIVIRTVRRLGGSRRSKWIIATIFVLVVTVISLTVNVALLRNRYHQAAGTDKTPKLLVFVSTTSKPSDQNEDITWSQQLPVRFPFNRGPMGKIIA